MTDELLEEQIRYYRERAPEYDATSRPDGDPFDKITREAIGALRTMGPVERAIELGAGTGQFTGLVASVARQVTAVDSSPQALALNVAKVTAPNVERVAADLFAWQLLVGHGKPLASDAVAVARRAAHSRGQRSSNTRSSAGRRALPGADFGRFAASLGCPMATIVRTSRSAGRPRTSEATGRTSERIQAMPAARSSIPAAMSSRSAARPSS